MCRSSLVAGAQPSNSSSTSRGGAVAPGSGRIFNQAEFRVEHLNRNHSEGISPADLSGEMQAEAEAAFEDDLAESGNIYT